MLGRPSSANGSIFSRAGLHQVWVKHPFLVLGGSLGFLFLILGLSSLSRATQPLPYIVNPQKLQAAVAAESLSDCDALAPERPLQIRCMGIVLGKLIHQLQHRFPQAVNSPCMRWGYLQKLAKTLTDAPLHADVNTMLYDQATIMGWDLIHPAASCPGEQRVGVIGDGGKWVCLPMKTSRVKDVFKKDCVIYSFGVYNSGSFEEEMVDLTGCEIHGFDPTPGLVSPYRQDPHLTFHRLGLMSTNGYLTLKGQKVPGKTLETIMKDMKHSRLQLLKVDVEGSEWDVMSTFFQKGVDLPFDQLQMELHIDDSMPDARVDHVPVMRLVLGLLELGVVNFHREVNSYVPHTVTETSFIKISKLLEMEPACQAS